MKRLVLIATLLMATAAQAEQRPAWQQNLEQYKVSLEQVSPAGLQMRQGFYIGAAMTTCALSVVVTGATFVSDTVPVTNILGEGLANIANPDYETYEKILSWETLANTGRGMAGGGVVAVAESLEFVVLWLGGNEAQSYEGLKKTYASTVATAEAMFAEQSKCMMSISKVLLTRAEIQKRSQRPSPLLPPADIVRP